MKHVVLRAGRTLLVTRLSRRRATLAGVGASAHRSRNQIDSEIVTEFERLRIIAPGLLADAVGQPVAFLLQVLGHAGEACYFALK